MQLHGSERRSVETAMPYIESDWTDSQGRYHPARTWIQIQTPKMTFMLPPGSPVYPLPTADQMAAAAATVLERRKRCKVAGLTIETTPVPVEQVEVAAPAEAG